MLAHIRHKYTHYDFLLHTIGYMDARRTVEEPCLQQILKWRGEDSTLDDEVEEIFREVIILDDEDLDQSETNRASPDRESSVEIISVRRPNASSTDLGSSDLGSCASDEGARISHKFHSHDRVSGNECHHRQHGIPTSHNLDPRIDYVARLQPQRKRRRVEETQKLQVPILRTLVSAHAQKAITSHSDYDTWLQTQVEARTDPRLRKRERRMKTRTEVDGFSYDDPSASVSTTLTVREPLHGISKNIQFPGIIDLTRSSPVSVHPT